MAASGALGTVPNRLWVKYATSTVATASVNSTRVVKDVALKSGGGALHALAFASAADAQTAAQALLSQSNVVSVTPVHKRRLSSDSLGNDYLLDNVDQWYNYRTKVDTGTPATSGWTVAAANASSTPVKIAIIDTGMDETNTDINSKTVYKESVITNSATPPVQQIATGNGSVQDSDGHGTNVAGLALAQLNNEVPSEGPTNNQPYDSTAYAGVAGVGSAVQLLSFKIFPPSTAANESPDADTDDEAKAIDDAVSQGASVISMSLGGPQCEGADPGEETAVEAAITAGVVVVAAAGNEYPAAEGNVPDYPGGYPGVIAVGASAVTDPTMSVAPGASPVPYSDIESDTVASYSNSGPTLVAPGGDENTSITGPDDTGDPDLLHWIEGYDTTTGGDANLQCQNPPNGPFPSATEQVCAVLFNGTSQATPQVSGAIALMESVHGGPKSITPAQAAAYLTSTAQLIPGVPATRQGAGLLNVFAAVSAAKL